MDLDYTQEQKQLTDSLRRMLTDKCGTDVVRKMEGDEKGYPDELWRAVTEMGLPGLTIAEEYGGLGLGALELAIVFEELGRALAPVPLFVSSVLSAGLLARAGSDEQKREWLPAIAAGEAVLSLAWLEPGNSFSERGVQLSANADANGYRLTGKKFMVQFAAAVDRLIVFVRSGRNPTDIDLVLVDPRARGVSLKRHKTMAADAQFEVSFDNVEVQASARLGAIGSGWEHWQDVLRTGMTALAAWGVGCGERAMELGTAYAKEREQFGKPIGSFQAIAHPFADAATLLAGARMITLEAAWAQDTGRPHKQLAMMAHLESCDATRVATKVSQNAFGGIGFTKDIDIQLFFRRSRQHELSWGSAEALNEEIGSQVLGQLA